MSTPRRLVVDASALVAWARDERGSDVVEKVLPHAVVSAANLAEALVICKERGWSRPLENLRDLILDTGLAVEPNTESDSLRAAELLVEAGRQDGKRVLALGDGLCLALAERLELPVTGGDTAWEQLTLQVKYAPFR